MAITVDIADRLYDYTDEEKAAEAVAEYQVAMDLDDQTVLAVWSNVADPRRTELEGRIFKAVDANGSLKRAQESVPAGISLSIEAQ
jgi:hypothetical protein